MSPRKKKTVCIDLDGVLADYDHYRGKHIVGEPLPGGQEAMMTLHEKYWVVVLSARANKPSGIEWIENWLRQHGIYFDEVTDRKPPAIAYVDDRAIKFINWRDTINKIEGLDN